MFPLCIMLLSTPQPGNLDVTVPGLVQLSEDTCLGGAVADSVSLRLRDQRRQIGVVADSRVQRLLSY